ncbi:hypothetical protein ACMGGS_20930 [Superficieibacter sp. BNK-5]|uniref:hypothetical protein n=1 Tax=Superficieibacter sp. BNK-5 TaxID=3376142 RepID=UPI0039BFC80C
MSKIEQLNYVDFFMVNKTKNVHLASSVELFLSVVYTWYFLSKPLINYSGEQN